MKIIQLMLVITTAGQIFAQQSFYVRPKIENKINQSVSEKPQTGSFFNSNYKTDYEPIPYGTVKASPFVTSKSFTFGLNVGMKFKNNDLIELGWNEDLAGSKIVMSSKGYSPNFPDNYFMSNNSVFSVNLINQRFELLYYKRRKTYRDTTLLNIPNSYLVFGTGFKYLSSAVSPSNPHDGTTFYSSAGSYDSISMEWEHQVFGWSKFSSFFTFGISADLHFNKTYLFSWSANYTVGLNILQTTKDKLNVFDNGTLIKTYNYETYSRGSGFQFQISRKLQFYPWKKWKKKKDDL